MLKIISLQLRYIKLEQAQALVDVEGQYDIKVNVEGGGITGQAEAIRLGISCGKIEPDHRLALKPEGLLTQIKNGRA